MNVINSTLGGLIKDYRLQKGISQLDIAFSMGWKEPSRLSRIEQGKTERPPRELVDKIIYALDLDEEEKNALLLTGGYLPTEDEIIKFRQEIDPLLDKLEYPISIMDFSWRIIYLNKAVVKLHLLDSQMEKQIKESHPRILNIVLTSINDDSQPQTEINPDLLHAQYNFLKDLIFKFKYEQRYRTKEKWYITHLRELMDNELFRKLWMETNIKNELDGVIGKYSERSFIDPNDKNKILNFNLFVLPVLKDPRFELTMFVPKDVETHRHYAAISNQ